MDESLRELYQEVILDHSRHPRHFGALEGATNTAEGHNPLCGDRVKINLIVDKDDRIKDISFEKLIDRAPERALQTAVRGMLPHNPLGRAMFRKLKVYAGTEHPHAAQQPQPLNI